jgi:hypothetical protein
MAELILFTIAYMYAFWCAYVLVMGIYLAPGRFIWLKVPEE